MADYSNVVSYSDSADRSVNDPDDSNKKLTAEAKCRLEACEAQKREYDQDIREAYFFAAPHRAREIRSAQAASSTKPRDADELFTGIAFELAKDFINVVMDAFMPQAQQWAERRPGMFIPDKLVAEVEKQVSQQDPRIFDAIRASNLYEELPKAFTPDLTIGTAALWIEDIRPAENIVVQAIPLHELEINLGPFGAIDDRFVVRHTKNSHVKALLGPAIFDKLPAEKKKDIEDPKKQDQTTIIRWGFWRLWDERSDVCWQHVVMLDMKVVHSAELKGEGACPLIPMRFNPSPEWAYGNGPLIESLPDLRMYDDLVKGKIEYVDLTLRPPSSFPDDSFTAIEQGLKAGDMVPIRPGSEDAIKSIFAVGSMEPAIFETSELERVLLHRFFLDGPRQRGDTPPTATQWLDEVRRLQSRLGTPGSSFFKEGPAQIFLRFQHILQKRGMIAPIMVDGKTVSLEPYNPAQRAAEQQEIAETIRYLETAMTLFPEEAKARIDGSMTMVNLAKKARVTPIVVFRTDEQIKAALQMIAPLLGQQGGAAGGEGAPPAPGAAPPGV